MSVDARWICHTCKTICFANGARSYLNYKLGLEAAEEFLKFLDTSYNKIFFSSYTSEFYESNEVRSLRHFVKWAGRHKGHRLLLTNDHSVSPDDFPDYKAETVDGVVSKTSFSEDMESQAQYYLETTVPDVALLLGTTQIEKGLLG